MKEIEEVVEEVEEEVVEEVVSDEVEAEPKEEEKKEEEDTYGDEPVDDKVEVKESKDTDDGSGDKGEDDLIKDDDPKGVKERIGTITKARRTAERKVSSLEKENAYLKGLKDGGKEEPVKEEPEVDVAPVEEDYEDMGDYYKAVAEHSGKVAVKEAMAIRDEKDKATEAETTKDTRAETHRKRVEAAIEIHPDYVEKVFADDGSLPISEEMYENIVDSEKGAEVAYYLAEHPDEAQEIYDLDSPREVARAMGRIEDKVSTPQKKTTKKVTSAPDPISPGPGGKSVSKKRVEDMSMAEYMKSEDAKEAALER